MNEKMYFDMLQMCFCSSIAQNLKCLHWEKNLKLKQYCNNIVAVLTQIPNNLILFQIATIMITIQHNNINAT